MTTPASRTRRGFTLIELLTVIAIIGVLAAILIPTVSRVRESAKRAKCMSNVRQLTLSLISQANQNKNQKFPENNGGNWAWDMTHSIIKDAVGLAGREVLYCPSSQMLLSSNIESMYNFSPNNYAVASYILLLNGTKQLDAVWKNDRIKDIYMNKEGATLVPVAPSKRLLVVDAVISTGVSAASFENVPIGGLPVNVSNHMNGRMPSGAHAGYVDGHVRWRRFILSTTPGPEVFSIGTEAGSQPRFWF